MTIREFYTEAGGEYGSVMERFLDEDRVRRFLQIFTQDPSYGSLVLFLSEGKTKEAFQAAHTLKGVCLNMDLTRLYHVASSMTEALREQDLEAARAFLPELTKEYEAVMEGIKKI